MIGDFSYGAGGGNRTRTPFRAPDFESRVIGRHVSASECRKRRTGRKPPEVGSGWGQALRTRFGYKPARIG